MTPKPRPLLADTRTSRPNQALQDHISPNLRSRLRRKGSRRLRLGLQSMVHHASDDRAVQSVIPQQRKQSQRVPAPRHTNHQRTGSIRQPRRVELRP
jgi:hypothetical protein